MAVLVFGKTGQVATELARVGGDDVVCLGRAEADLADPDACAAIIRDTDATGVINAAAYTAVDNAEDEEALATVINGDAPAAMARAAAERGLPFVHISTDYVFDGSGVKPWLPEDETAPLGAYGRSKLAGERGVVAAGGTFAILRTSWVFSSHGSNFVKTMLRLAETKDHLTIVEDQIGGPTEAGDIARACLAVARGLSGATGQGGIYHFSGRPDVSWADFAREIFAQADLKVSVEGIPASAYPTKAKRPGNSRMDCSSLQASFGVTRPDWRESLGRVLADLST
jgi:dTDP-4-dehydrorhamnose reductase